MFHSIAFQKEINIFGNLQQIATRMVIQYGWGPDDNPTIYHYNNAVPAILFNYVSNNFISRECAPLLVYTIYYSVSDLKTIPLTRNTKMLVFEN